MSYPLIKIDELLTADHHFLEPEDQCYYVMEFTKWVAGDPYSEGNDVINNLKKKMDRRGKADWHYKAININKVGDIFAGIFTNPSLAGRIIIPMPPSKCKVLSSSVFGANLTFSFWVVLLSVGACL